MRSEDKFKTASVSDNQHFNKERFSKFCFCLYFK